MREKREWAWEKVSLRTRVSQTGDSLFEELGAMERLHLPDTSFVCLSDTAGMIVFLCKRIAYIVVTPLFFSWWLLIVGGEFFLVFWVAGVQGACFTSHSDRRNKFFMNYIIPHQWLFRAQRGHEWGNWTNCPEAHVVVGEPLLQSSALASIVPHYSYYIQV